MSDFIMKIDDDALNAVSGGATTPYGFPCDEKGNVIFTDKQGVSIKISASDWQWLLTQYDGNKLSAESNISTVPAHDVQMMINDHNSPFKK